MDYPAKLSRKILDRTHKTYKQLSPVWDTIDDFVIGGSRIKAKADQYVQKIPGELPEVYQARIEKFTFESVMGSSVQELIRKLSTSTITITGLPEGDNNIYKMFFDAFRNISGENDKPSDLILASTFFYNLINYGRIYIELEQNGRSTDNLATDLQLGIIPYINIHHPSSVINWGVDNTGSPWYKLKTETIIDNPFSSNLELKTEWKFIDSEKIAIYSHKKPYNDLSLIREDDWRVDTTEIDLETEFPHGFSEKIFCVEIDKDKWVGNIAYLLQEAHMRELNTGHDIRTMLYVQRTYKPRVSVEEDLETISDVVETALSGNATILDVESFNFNEPSGSASKTLSEHCDKIKAGIRALYGLGVAEGTQGALERSGLSKEMDFISARDILEQYGEIIIPIFNRIFNTLKNLINYPETIFVAGLSNFQVDTLSGDIEHAIKIQEIETQLSPTALQIFYSRISKEIIGSCSPEIENIIDAEVENIFKAPVTMLNGDLDDGIQ